MPAEELRDFLISYHAADRAWGEWVAWQLGEAGYTTALLACDHASSAQFIARMQAGTGRAERTIVLLSPEFVPPGLAMEGWETAFADDPTGTRGLLSVLRIEACDSAALPSDLACVDFVGLNFYQAAERLLALAGGQRPMRPGTFRSRSAFPQRRPPFPGLPPSIWNVPFARNPFFAGRDGILSDLRTALATGRPVALVHGIHGPGGIGKRQIAIEYAYRFGADYDAVFWVPAHSPATLRDGIAALARDIGLEDQSQTGQPAAVEAVQTWLHQQERWLLILENAAGPADVAEYLSQGGDGHVLITSRHARWEGVAATLEVPVLARLESVQLFEKRMGPADPTTAGIVASELGDFPLALAQAAGYITSARVSIAAFREQYRARRAERWKSGAGPADYPRTIATILDLALRKLPETVVELLRLCVFLGSEGIPLWLFAEHAGDLPELLRSAAANPLQFRACLHELTGYGLVEATDTMLWVHPRLQEVIAERLPDYDQRRFTQLTLRLTNAAFDVRADDPQTAESNAPLVPHALCVLKRARACELSLGMCGKLAHRLGLYFRHRGNRAEARRLLKQAIEIKQKAFTHDHPTLATTYSHLGIVEQEIGNLAEARELLREALAINELAYAHDHPTLAASYSNLGLLEYALGNLPEARRRLGEALDVSHKAFAPDSAAVADACFQLALVEQELGNVAAASGHMRKTCTMRLTLLGEKHPATQASIEWLMTNDEEFRKAMEDKERETGESRHQNGSGDGESEKDRRQTPPPV